MGIECGRYVPRPRAIEIVACTLAVARVLTYVAYVAIHWAPFVEQMRFQMARKQALLHAMPRFLFGVKKLAFVAVYVGAIVVSLVAVRRALLPLLLGLTCFATFITTREMWYDVYFVVSMMLLAGGIILIVERYTENVSGVWRHIPFFAVALFFLVFARREDFVEGPQGYPARMAWHEMKMSDGAPYMTPEDIKSVTTALDSVARDNRLRTIQFYPFADALVFWPEISERWLVVQPLFVERQADVIVLHSSRYLPASWNRRPEALRNRFTMGGWRAGRDSTETWCIGVARAQ